jgi:hypothetical protein
LFLGLTGKTPSRDNETAAQKSAPDYRQLPPQTSSFSQVWTARRAGTALAELRALTSVNRASRRVNIR